MKSIRTKIAMISLFALAACDATDSGAEAVPGRWYTEARVSDGRELYDMHCALCHGSDGSATADWRSPGPDGNYPPPPLNGTAHTWHHPLAMLDATISEGGAKFGGVMPGFGGKLDREQRLSVIAFVQSHWPDDIYAKWEQIDRRSR